MNTNLEQYYGYKILVKEELIIEYYYGEVTSDVIIGMKEMITNDRDYNPEYNSILDFRDSVFHIEQKCIEEITEYIKKNMVMPVNRKVALLTHTPMHVVVTTLFTSHNKNLPIQYKIFSTLRAASAWIVSGNKFKLIRNTIDKLRI